MNVRVFPFATKETLLEVLKWLITEDPTFTYRVEVDEMDDECECNKKRIEFAHKNSLAVSKSMEEKVPLNEDIVDNLDCFV
jgi:elongation factor P hydroxylase